MLLPFKEYYNKSLQEAELEPELQRKQNFDTIRDPNPKEVISGTQYAARIQEPSEYSEGYVFVYDTTNNEIATRLFWTWNEEFGIQVPQTQMIETSKKYEGKKLSLLAYQTLIDVYEKLITDKQLTQMSVNNWAKNMYPRFKKNIFIINDDNFLPWNGDQSVLIGNNNRIIILKNTSDVRRIMRKYSD